MASFNATQIITQMKQSGLVPLFYHPEVETAKQVLKACYQGGSRLLEFTNRGDQALAVFDQLEEYVRQELPEMMLGAGSVMDWQEAIQFIEAGADFIVAPILDEQVAAVCEQHKVPWSPGCGTLTEIIRAERLGAQIIKVFPGSHMGPGFIKAVRGPCSHLQLMPTGGVQPTEENLRGWFQAGAVCVGMGSKLIKKEFLRNRQYQELQQHVANSLKLTQTIKNNS